MQTIRRRRVFYIPGYDPVPPRRYRELYRREAQAQAKISGYAITLGPRQVDGPFGWHVTGQFDGATVETEMSVLVWSDIVRDSMGQTIPATYAQLVRTAWTYLATGALFRLMRLRKGPVIAALYPVVVLLAQLLLAVAIGGGVAAALAAWLPPDPVAYALAAAAGLASLWATLRWFRAVDRRIFAYYLMHDYAFTARDRGAIPPALSERMEPFGRTIADALSGPVDEVLIVGHSSGAHVAISVLADLIRADRVPEAGPALAFLSLGQVVPMVSFLPGAARLRADLRFLSEREELAWIDVSAPGDGCAFALCDPVAVTGVAGPAKRWPLVLSAAFTQTLSPARWRGLRWRFFRLHFQYLCAFDRPGDYDYFRITAGPCTLAARFAGRAPSKSRIETPASGYRDMAR